MNDDIIDNFKKSKSKLLEREATKKAEHQTKDLCFMSANLANFLPDIDISQDEKIYQDVLLTRLMLLLETKHFEIYDKLSLVGESYFNKFKGNPKIFCTYHLGSYRAIIGLLAKNELDFALLVDQNTLNSQQDDIIELVDRIHKEYGTSGFFEILNAEKPNIAIILPQYLKKNISIVAYIDGNTGTGGIFNKNADLLKINFLNNEILVRKGIAYLSYITKKGIIPVISYYERFEMDPPKIEFFEGIDPTYYESDRASYVEKVTKSIWEILETKLKKYTGQWEGWLYIHKYLMFENNATIFNKRTSRSIDGANDKIRFYLNNQKYGLFKIEEDNYIINKENYAINKISPTLFDLLIDIDNKSLHELLNINNCSSKLLNDLLSMNIINY